MIIPTKKSWLWLGADRQIPICRTDGIRFRRAERNKKVLIILKNRIIENKNVEKTP